MNFTKFLRVPFLQNTSGRLLLELLVYDPVVSIEEAVHRYSKKKLVWQILHKSTKKELYQSLFFDNILGLKPATLLKRESGKVFFFCE